ncbi:MAG TPA: hypothetical protein PLW67_00735 [Prolixibacteraceae bacterium]|nr:hypothetical protein [Prolixibacteraceae bacterium]
METFDPLLFAELVIILLVIAYQLAHTRKVYLNIRKFSAIFTHPLKVKSGYANREELKDPHSFIRNLANSANDRDTTVPGSDPVRFTITETQSKCDVMIRMEEAINSYLISNYGAEVNFSIIRDIIDRETEAVEEEISQAVPAPLYLGLAATMVGIIFGLLAIPDIDGKNFTEGINRLIEGVRLAITASLTGLLCTTIISTFFFKNARKKSLLQKNAQLSYLQAELLPELVRTEESGISGLRASLDRFAREATTITGHVRQSALQTSENLQVQDSIIARLERLNMSKVSRANLEMFTLLEKNMDAFRSFSGYLTEMEEIASNLKEFALRTSRIDNISMQIQNTLSESKELVNFLKAHFDKIEHTGTAALRAVDLSDSHFRESVELLKTRTNASVESLFRLSDKTESDLKGTLEKITEKIAEATHKHIEEFVLAYSNAIPRFGNLELLQPIRESIDTKSDALIRQSEKNHEAVLSLIQEVSGRLTGNGNPGSDHLETAVRELTEVIRSGRHNPENRKEKLFATIETVLRIVALAGIVVFCTLEIISWFKNSYTP